jgi:hypothetical protein
MLVAFKSQLTNRFYPDGTDYIIFLSARTGNEFHVSRLFFFFEGERERGEHVYCCSLLKIKVLQLRIS